jgi:bifunctional UDP-N-acetylglucosamine pyrophosphorylase/glucosamine-1-phosphate N-acetyltransferase
MSDAPRLSTLIQSLLDRGVKIPCPFSVEVDDSLNPERVAPGVIVHTGCRIAGEQTLIGPGSELGREAPVVIENCQLGHRVDLKGGYFSGATFLDDAGMGSAAHVRPGTLLEEEARGAHAVGFKMTIFLPYVTAGSLINFCDALMAGGSSQKNHSEIGSSYIHFNYTPHQDKATPSLIGDVPRGVFLDQNPVFLGGQGGLVGPARIAYGTIVPAGIVCRKDILEEGTLFAVPQVAAKGTRVFVPGIYHHINRIVKNNLIYIGNLWALRAWYRYVRIRTMSGDIYRKACHAGALMQIEAGLKERVRRLSELAEKMPHSLKHARAQTGDDLLPRIYAQQRALIDKWPEIEKRLEEGPPAAIGAIEREIFLKAWDQIEAASSHIDAVATLNPSARKAGISWLQSIVDSASALWTEI